MNVIVSNSSEKPIYEQIASSIKEEILSGTLSGGEMLPSIRTLAKDLNISNITTKRAYEELEKSGYIETIPGRGCFVKNKNKDLLKEEVLKKIEDNIISAINIAKTYSISQKEVTEIMESLYEEE